MRPRGAQTDQSHLSLYYAVLSSLAGPATQPPVVRDISLVVPGGVTAAAIEALLAREGGTLLERLDVLDEYRGEGLPAGTRGVTWRCTFRASDRSLTDLETTALLAKMLRATEESLGVQRRQASA